DLRAQAQAAHVLAVAPLLAYHALAFLLLGFALHLGGDGEHAVLERDADVVFLYAGDFGGNDVFIVALADVEREGEIARGLFDPATRAQEVFKHALDVVVPQAPAGRRDVPGFGSD